MKNLFYNIGEFMYRRPTAENKEVDYSEGEMMDICKDSCFREKVHSASPALVEMMNVYLERQGEMSEKKLTNLQVSVMKYLIRSRTRTTPFGLFSGVGKGEFKESNKFSKLESKHKKKINIDTEWIFGLIKYLENEHVESLSFKFNDACYVKGKRAILLYSTEKDTDEISVRYTRVFETLYSFIKGYETYETIIKKICDEYPGIAISKIQTYVGELVSKEFLISDLRPSLNNPDPIQYFIKKCRKVGLNEMSESISEIQHLCKEYIQTEIGDGISKYNEIIAKMKKVFQSSSYLQVDTIIEGGNFQLSKDIANQINELASFFVYISNGVKKRRTHMEHYKNKFLEKYGVDREVQLLEMMDSNKGIGAPALYLKPQNDFYDEYTTQDNYKDELKNYFMERYENALINKSGIDIDMAYIEKIADCEVDAEEIPISLELYFMLKQKNGNVHLSLSPNCGSFVAGKTFGRFSVLSTDFASILEKCNYEERKIRAQHIDICELSFLPSPMRSGNIVRTLSFRDKETAIFTNGNEKLENRISLSDIYIGIQNEKFYARDRKSGKQIVFESNNMFNPMLNPNVLRFLQEISYEGRRSWSEFPWDYIYAGFRHVPAIKFKNIVLANEKWKLCWKDFNLSKNSYDEFKEKFEVIAVENKMPSEIYIVDVDNRIKLNLNNELSINIVYDELKKHKDRDLVFEKIEEGDDLEYDDGCAYATEVVVPLFRKNTEHLQSVVPTKISVPDKKRVVVPFDDWLYLKLYCNHSREEELIAFDIMDFCEDLRQKYGIDYFYMRYIDPKPHIRLRFHAPHTKLLQAYPEIMKWYSQMFTNQIVGDMSIAVYEREIERYGGLRLMNYAEQLFFEDSYSVESILRLKRFGKFSMSLEDIAIISTIMYVMRFYEKYDEQLQFLTANYHTSDFLSQFKNKKDNLLEICDFENKWKKLNNDEDGKILFELLSKRNPVIDLYRTEIDVQNSDPVFKNGIVSSVIHLHCNRLIGTDREKERKLMAFAESVVYAKRYIMNNRRKDING